MCVGSLLFILDFPTKKIGLRKGWYKYPWASFGLFCENNNFIYTV